MLFGRKGFKLDGINGSMKSGSYSVTMGMVCGILAIAFLIVAIYRWSIIVSSFSIPFWASWILTILFAYFSYEGFLIGFSAKSL